MTQANQKPMARVREDETRQGKGEKEDRGTNAIVTLPIQRRLVYRAQLWYCSTSAGIGALQVDYYAGCRLYLVSCIL
ncbi:hypothetical protein N7524_005597 [Penicillium chrysogenum]|nr:hypothetical protein N7524_005597 [Penicillium chrysogenum]